MFMILLQQTTSNIIIGWSIILLLVGLVSAWQVLSEPKEKSKK